MSNYFADGFQGGFAIGAAAREKKKDREERAKIEKARADLELDLVGRRASADKELQNDRLVADAQRQFNQQGFQSGESEKDRGFRGGESEKERTARVGLQTGAQGFQSGQAELDRAARAAALDREMKQRQGQFEAELPLKGAQLGLQAGKQSWEENAANPQNVNALAHAKYLAGNTVPDLPNPQAALQNGTKGMAAESLPTLSPEEARSARPGTRYRTTDGRVMVR